MESRKKSNKESGLQNLIKNKKFFAFAGVVVLVAAVALTGILLPGKDNKKKPVQTFSTQEKETESGTFSPLTGEKVKAEVLDRRPVAVMVENYWEARPQSGLDKADVVYEILAEGGITRFLAIYQQNNATEIGPVRSVRPYFVQRALEYDPMYAHVGASSLGTEAIKKSKIIDLDEMILGKAAYWRITDRKAPHNAYTSIEKLRAYAEKKGYDKKVKVPAFLFLKQGEENINGQEGKKINIDYAAKENKVLYQYDSATRLYNRSHVTGIHKDKVTDKQLTARNIIIQFVPSKVILPDGVSLGMEMVGQGKAILVTGGKSYTGRWSKKGDRERTIFTDDKGKEFKLNPGQTWIEVVPPETPVGIK